MTSINLVFRKSVRPGRHRGSLMFRLIHDRRVKTVTIPGCRLYPEEWDSTNHTIVFPENDPVRGEALELVAQLLEEEKALLGIYIASLEKKGVYTVEDVSKLYRLRKNDGKIVGYAEHLAFELERRGQVRTARAYITVSRGLVSYNRGVDIPLTQINKRLIKEFELYLKNLGKLPNTVSYYMRNLRSIYNKAIMDSRITKYNENPFAGVYTGVTRTRKRALTPDELKLLHGLNFTKMAKKMCHTDREREYMKILEEAHRYFFFCFYARGMCFIDLAHLRKENVKGDFIRYVRKKTGQQIEVRLTTKMREIIESFSSSVIHLPYLFPILERKDPNTKQKYESALRLQNQRLKMVASLAGIHKPLTTHWARHSWATVGKLTNVPLRVISECLGHTSESTTRIYLGLLDNSVLDAANEVISSAINYPIQGQTFSTDAQTIQDY